LALLPRSIRKHPRFRRWQMQLGVGLFRQLLRFTGVTAQVSRENEAALHQVLREDGAFLLSTWHENIYFSTWMLRDLGLTALISSSRDGEAIYGVMRHFNFEAVRGSSTRGGALALREMLQVLERKRSVAITPDGPTGPLHQVQSGILLLAKKSGLPILPWHYEVRDLWRLKSWDSHKIPKPFTLGVGRFGTPLHIPPGVRDLTEWQGVLEERMEENVQEVRSRLQE
jgi:lysophospholipid acyltransferase (LPLAT)-like uncharacterized protein